VGGKERLLMVVGGWRLVAGYHLSTTSPQPPATNHLLHRCIRYSCSSRFHATLFPERDRTPLEPCSCSRSKALQRPDYLSSPTCPVNRCHSCTASAFSDAIEHLASVDLVILARPPGDFWCL